MLAEVLRRWIDAADDPAADVVSTDRVLSA
jgi:hypothetical protein